MFKSLCTFFFLLIFTTGAVANTNTNTNTNTETVYKVATFSYIELRSIRDTIELNKTLERKSEIGVSKRFLESLSSYEYFIKPYAEKTCFIIKKSDLEKGDERSHYILKLLEQDDMGWCVTKEVQGTEMKGIAEPCYFFGSSEAKDFDINDFDALVDKYRNWINKKITSIPLDKREYYREALKKQLDTVIDQAFEDNAPDINPVLSKEADEIYIDALTKAIHRDLDRVQREGVQTISLEDEAEQFHKDNTIEGLHIYPDPFLTNVFIDPLYGLKILRLYFEKTFKPETQPVIFEMAFDNNDHLVSKVSYIDDLTHSNEELRRKGKTGLQIFLDPIVSDPIRGLIVLNDIIWNMFGPAPKSARFDSAANNQSIATA